MSLSAITKKAMKVIADEQAGARVVDPAPTAHSPAVINAMRLRAAESETSASADEVRRVWRRADAAERRSRARFVREDSVEARESWQLKDAACKDAYKQWDAARSVWHRALSACRDAEFAAFKSEIERLRSRTETEVLKDEVALLRAKVAKLEVALANEKASVAGLLAESLE